MSMRMLVVSLVTVTAVLATGAYFVFEGGVSAEAIVAGAVLVWLVTGGQDAPGGSDGWCSGCGCG